MRPLSNLPHMSRVIWSAILQLAIASHRTGCPDSRQYGPWTSMTDETVGVITLGEGLAPQLLLLGSRQALRTGAITPPDMDIKGSKS